MSCYPIHRARLGFNIDVIRALIYRRQAFQARAPFVRLQENDLQQASENYSRNCKLMVSPWSPANTQSFSEPIRPEQPE
jgi:O-glycosyl hydrolase